MNISFDLDGVIAEGNRWFFRLLEPLRKTDPDAALVAELDYYASRPLKCHPNQFLSGDDKGIIITARKPWAQDITNHWLREHGILQPVYFVDTVDYLDWGGVSYAETSAACAALKATVLRTQGIDVHFDNNAVLVAVLRERLPNIRCVLVGGERIP